MYIVHYYVVILHFYKKVPHSPNLSLVYYRRGLVIPGFASLVAGLVREVPDTADGHVHDEEVLAVEGCALVKPLPWVAHF